MNDPITIYNCIEIDPIDFLNFRQSQLRFQFLGETFVTLYENKMKARRAGTIPKARINL